MPRSSEEPVPEFAEINTQVRWLRERVLGWEIEGHACTGKGYFAALKDNPRRDAIVDAFFHGARIEGVAQRGKYVTFRLSTGTMVSHLMFKGRWSIAGDDFISNYKQHREPPAEKSVRFYLGTRHGRLNFHEPDGLGKVHVFPNTASRDCPELADLGPEAFITPETDEGFAGREWQLDDLLAGLPGVKGPIKTFLLDQKRQAGLGNMYVCEALYRAGVSPARPSNAVTRDEAAKIYREARAVLRQAIETDLDYDRVLAVYKRERDPEGRKVECSDIGGRDTYWVREVQT
jgi:DNA-formamidopyrimidine glycosylase